MEDPTRQRTEGRQQEQEEQEDERIEALQQRLTEQEAINEAEWEKPSSWRFGLFYYNARDSRPWVPKRSVLGRRPTLGGTPNFAHRSARLHMMLVLGVMVLIFLLVVALENSGALY